ncbi:fungal-specific transcription factor domain-domain-containing protein [Absidia repens]|uniref:Fungal-specific transcription factor domain-domain-containing protein n=1 Tax=Absidia repens TaxID=90262 RepID=A0A1X2IZ22_9FUNG|nr:fungal-specific transcription factor domain-domain-containing protein [Absidia repens]
MSWPPQSPVPSSSISTLSTGTAAHINWHNQQQASSQIETQMQSPPSSSKRSRISRACDTCRKKKIKCNVDNCFPCTTCQQYDWDCTFNETSRKRGPPKGYIGGLEARLERMEHLLCKIQGTDPGNDVAATQPTSPLRLTIVDSNSPPSATENSTYAPLGDSPTGQPSGNPTLPPKGKVVRYLGSSSGLYLVNDILRTRTQSSNSVNESSVLASSPLSSLSSSSSTSSSPSIIATATMHTNYGNDHPSGNDTTGSDSAHGATSSGKPAAFHQSAFKSPTAENTKLTDSSTTRLTPNYDNSFTSLKTDHGTCRLRRVNGFDDDLVMVRDDTEDETKAQAVAANEQETMDSIVPRSILAGLIKVYFDDDCRTLPILDQEEFTNSFEGKTTALPAPLLTYAICSYACFLVPSNHQLFIKSGLNRNKIFQALFDRAGMFLRAEYLIPKIQTIQALVLLSAHPTYISKSNRNWILAGMAVRMAQDLGLHRLVTNDGCSMDVIERRRRLWYSVYLTDRWCCCVLGRPLAIADSDCDVDLPSADAGDQPGKYALFVNLVKLSGILGEVLRRIYSSKAKSLGYGTHIMEQTVWSLDKMLKEWFDQVPSEYLITPEQLKGMKGVEHTYKNVFRLGGPLTVCYYAVIILLFRPFLVFERCTHHSSKLFDDAPKRCMDAAKHSIDVARHIPKDQIPRFGWNFAAYSVFQAALIHIYNGTNNDPFIAQTSRSYIRIAIGECVAPLSKDIPFGPPILQFLEILLHLTKTDSPIRSPSSPNKASGAATTTMATTAEAATLPISDKSSTSHLPASFRSITSDIPYASGLPPTHTPSGSSMSSQHFAAGSTLDTTNLISSMLPNATYGSNRSDLINSTTAQDLLLQNPSNPMTQASWQMLFSFPGAPFTNTTNNASEFDLSWGSMYTDDQGNPNFGL